MFRLSCCPGPCVSSGRAGGKVVHVAKGKITDTANKQAVESAYKALAKAPHVTSAPDPFPNAASGLAASAKVIAAAAIIMISVFGSFILNGDPTIKQFGVGLSVAVLLASAMVLSLAPAMLTLFGGATWWLPGWLSRLLPYVDIEGEAEPPPPPAPGLAGEAALGAAMRAASRRRR